MAEKGSIFRWLSVAAALLLPLAAQAGDGVTGRYLAKAGGEVKIELKIAELPPALVIVIQNFPGGVEVLSSSPELKLADPGQGQAKWLLSNLGAGTHQLLLRLAKPVDPARISGEIRYRDPADGNMVARPISE